MDPPDIDSGRRLLITISAKEIENSELKSVVTDLSDRVSRLEAEISSLRKTEDKAIPEEVADEYDVQKVQDNTSFSRAMSRISLSPLSSVSSSPPLQRGSSSVAELAVDSFPTHLDKKRRLQVEVVLEPRKKNRRVRDVLNKPGSRAGDSSAARPTIKKEDDEAEILAAAAASITSFKIEEGKKVVPFDAATMQSRIDAVGRDPFPVSLDPSIRMVPVSREWMSAEYGGRRRGTFPNIGPENLAKHGMKYFMYPTLEMNPTSPRTPGETALFLQPWPAVQGRYPEVYRVLVRLATSKWLYMGQYKLEPAESLSRTEWLMQSDIVRNAWAKAIAIDDWGKPVRAKILLRRKKRREPTAAEFRAACRSKKMYKSEVTWMEVRTAYDKGQQTMGIWTMKCVGYDEKFQRDIVKNSR